MTKWIKEWPTEPGWYWFWGKTYKGSLKHELYMVQVWQMASGGLAYVTGGALLHEWEGAEGMWHPAVVPEPPPSVGGK